MKPKNSLKKNLSLPIVTFVAAVSGVVFNLALCKSATAQTKDSQFSEARLLAQVWTEVDGKRLSLGGVEDKGKGEELIVTQLPPADDLLIAQVWTEIDRERLSLATPVESVNNENAISIARSPTPTQLLAQLWTEIDRERLSLGRVESQSEQKLIVTQLPATENLLIAQVWTEIDRERLSLATPEVKPVSNENAISIAQLATPKAQLLAQLWTEIDRERLSLGRVESQGEQKLIVTQLPASENLLIAQVWTEIDRERLSLALSEVEPANKQELPAITQLLPQQQQLLVQLWSDVARTQVGLAEGATSNTPEIIITQLLPQQQQLLAQLWSDIRGGELTLARPETISRLSNDKRLLITQLLPQQQQLLAQLWSDVGDKPLGIASQRELSLATFSSPQLDSQSPNATPIEPKLLILGAEFNSRAKLVDRNWSAIDRQALGWESPKNELDSLAVLLDPSREAPPAAPMPSKEEIAARIVLKEVQIITPAPGVIIDGESDSSVTVRYPASASVRLQVNGKEVDDSLVTQEQLDFKTNLVTQTWSGQKLVEGKNQISIIARKSGFDEEITRDVILRDETEEVELLADATTPPESPTTDSPSDSSQLKPQKQPQKPRSTVSQPSPDDFTKILTPKADAVLDGISSSVIIQYPEEAAVILQLNGKSINPSQVGRTAINPITKIVTQTWYGVIFNQGANSLSLLTTTDGTKYAEQAIEVYVPGKPQGLKVRTQESHIPADGNSTALVKGEFIDEEGKTAIWNGVVTLNSSEGKFIGNDYSPDRPGFQVKADKGKFQASLQAGYDADNVTIQVKSNELEAFTRMQFKSTLRQQPLLTGFADLRIGARGTNYHDNFRDFLPLDEDDDAEIDFTSAAFIEGSFGRWSYRGAFNSDRALNEDSRGENRIFRTYSSSEQNYPVYGDSSSSEVVAPSTDNVYLRLERSSKIEFAEPDYFMWGDYNTEEFSAESQEFSAISRQLHGFKSNYNLGNLQLNAFFANNAEGFQRDAIAPDGTSGFYFLSRRLLIPGSEDVYVELTPLNDPGNVVSRQQLSLGLDYEIDYDRGTLLFKDPLLRTDIDEDGTVLVRRVVATYQFESEAADSTLIAGRGRYHFNRDLNQPTWLGMTYLNEDRGDLDFELFGLDAFASLGKWGHIAGEYANSENETIFANASGSAYRFEGEVQLSSDIIGTAYYSQADEGFANNATLSFVPGQTRYGSQLNARVAKGTSLRLGYERQDNNGVAPRPLNELEDFLDSTFDPVPGSRVDNSLSTITAGVEQQIGKAELGADLVYRDRQDNNVSGDLTSTSTQLRSRFSIPVIEKLSFHALSDLTLSDNTDAVFSDRLGVGLDYEFYSGLSLVLNHQWFTKGRQAGEALTTLGVQGEYQPWANATLTGKYGLTNGIEGINNTGSIGLQQNIPLTAGLDLDLNYERTFSDFDRDGTGRQFTQPFSVGQGAFALGFESGSSYSIGLSYSDDPDFTADAKFEYSDRENGDNTVISGGLTGKLSRALTSLLSYNQASSANQTFDIGTTRNLRIGLAYRDPKNDKLNGLLRYEYEENGGLVPETLLLGNGTGSQDHLFAGEVIYAPNWRWEFYSKLAYRNSKTFVADDFVSSSNITLGQFRTTYRLNYHVDLVGEARSVWQPSADYTESGFLLEAGYYLTPELRLAAGYVFGRADDEDFTGTRSAGGPYFAMTMKLNSLLDGFGQHRPPSLPEGVSKKAEGRRQKAEGRRQKAEGRRQKTGKKSKQEDKEQKQEAKAQGSKVDKQIRQADKEIRRKGNKKAKGND